jgi:hypothetical protein
MGSMMIHLSIRTTRKRTAETMGVRVHLQQWPWAVPGLSTYGFREESHSSCEQCIRANTGIGGVFTRCGQISEYTKQDYQRFNKRSGDLLHPSGGKLECQMESL